MLYGIRMLIRYVEAHNPDANTSSMVWLPRGILVRKEALETPTLGNVEVGGWPRRMRLDLLGLAIDFTSDAMRRRRLGHDCAVFALASRKHDSMRDRPFNQPGGEIVKVKGLELPDPEKPLEVPEVPHGGILLTADATPITSTDEFYYKTRPNFLIRATDDEQDEAPLYFSKLGVNGPAVLWTAASSMQFYPTQVVARVGELTAEPYPDTPQVS